MDNCFPDISISREDAIRQWLAKPAEFRAHSFDGNAENGKAGNSEISVAAPQEAKYGTLPIRASAGDVNTQSGWNPLTYGSPKRPHSDAPRNRSKLTLTFARYAVLALVISYLLWATPTNTLPSLAELSTATARSSGAKFETAVSAPAQQGHESVETASGYSKPPSSIESVSIGCKHAEPCIQISTRGSGIVPRLSTLTDPNRLVIDFEGASHSSTLQPVTVEHSAIKTVRIGENLADQPPGTRVVIDLATKCSYELQAIADLFVLKVHPEGTRRRPG